MDVIDLSITQVFDLEDKVVYSLKDSARAALSQTQLFVFVKVVQRNEDIIAVLKLGEVSFGHVFPEPLSIVV